MRYWTSADKEIRKAMKNFIEAWIEVKFNEPCAPEGEGCPHGGCFSKYCRGVNYKQLPTDALTALELRKKIRAANQSHYASRKTAKG